MGSRSTQYVAQAMPCSQLQLANVTIVRTDRLARFLLASWPDRLGTSGLRDPVGSGLWTDGTFKLVRKLSPCARPDRHRIHRFSHHRRNLSWYVHSLPLLAASLLNATRCNLGSSKVAAFHLLPDDLYKCCASDRAVHV